MNGFNFNGKILHVGKCKCNQEPMGPGEWGGCNGMPDVSFQRIHIKLEYITIGKAPSPFGVVNPMNPEGDAPGGTCTTSIKVKRY